MDITIYQINMGRDHNRIAFEGLDLLKLYQGSDKIDSRIYDRVFEGEVDCKDLEDVYRKFNLEHPEGYKGRSLSVSDVVEIVPYPCHASGRVQSGSDVEEIQFYKRPGYAPIQKRTGGTQNGDETGLRCLYLRRGLMAVTSIWPIKGRVDKVINYARNPEKTHDKKSLLKLHEIEGVIEYAADEMKTETRALVTCLNLSSEENAAKEFMEVKHRYGKEDGRVCYHGYQSFKVDEVDADTAHNIGVALAKELWGDRFQVVIATHCNTGHYHNHFVINSVSDVDGLKFYNSPEDYRHMREVSDRLCREARISVIDHPDGKKKNYGEWVAEKNGKPTVRDTIRADIDRAILASTTERDFISVMEEMGYKIETKTETGAPRQHPIVILHGKKHFRLDKLGEFYELESIKQRIQNNIRKRVPFPEVKEDKKAPYYHYKEKAQKATGLYALYLYYCYELHIIVHKPASIKKVSVFLREDVTKLDQYIAQADFLGRTGITTTEELLSHKTDKEALIKTLDNERKGLKNKQRQCARRNDESGAAEIKAQVDVITSEMSAIRKEIKLCTAIAERSARVQENLEDIRQQESERKEKTTDELLVRRSGRTSRENDPERG